jgi:hypothetical protein
MLPTVDRFISCLEEYKFLEVFNNCDAYLWSNFPYNHTWDIDIMFIGEPSEELGEKIVNFKSFAMAQFDLQIDQQVHRDTQVFRYIEEFMRLGTMKFPNLERFKMSEFKEKNPVKYNKYFYKYILTDMNAKTQFRVGKTNLHYPILIEDFIKLVFNIKNPDIYNTKQCKTFNEYRKLDEEWKDHIRR